MSKATKTAAKTPEWIVVFKHAGKVKVVRVPGGLHEAEARRSAALKVNTFAQFVRIYKEDPQQVRSNFDRTISLCLQSA